jgi:hypothetical protein
MNHRDHGHLVDEDRHCESPTSGGWNCCKNPPLVGQPYCFLHAAESTRPDSEPEARYAWEPLMDLANDRPYFWFQIRTPRASRRALALDRDGKAFSGWSRRRDEVWRHLERKGALPCKRIRP